MAGPGTRVPEVAARNHAEHNAAYAEALGGRVLRDDDLVAVDIDSPLAFLNAVVPLGPVASGRVAEVAAAFYGGRRYAVVDYFESVDLGAAGYSSADPLPVMVREAAPGPAPVLGLDVERVADATSLAAFERVVIVGSELTPYLDAPAHALWGERLVEHPTLRLYLGRIDGLPVTCAATVVEDDAVGVYAVSTVHEHRRRGYGAAVTAAALDDAPPVPAVLTASPLGAGMYTRLGFRAVARRRSWWCLG